MTKSAFLILFNLALIACGDNAGNPPASGNGSSPDTSTPAQSAPPADSAVKMNRDTSTTGNATPVGATDGSNNTGAVGGSTDAKNSEDTKTISGTGKNAGGSGGKQKEK